MATQNKLVIPDIETQGVLLWSYFTESGINSDPSEYATKDKKKVSIATTQARVETLIKDIADKVLPVWYSNLANLRVDKAALDKASKEVSELLKDPDPERIHNSLLSIQHVPTAADERPLTRAGNPTAAVKISKAWPKLPYIVSGNAPAFDKDANGIIKPGTFRALPTDIYVDDELRARHVAAIRPGVPNDEYVKLKDVFNDPDAWIDEYSWGWRVIMDCGFKISKGTAGLKIGIYPNKLHFNNHELDYPAGGKVGPASGKRHDDDL